MTAVDISRDEDGTLHLQSSQRTPAAHDEGSARDAAAPGSASTGAALSKDHDGAPRLRERASRRGIWVGSAAVGLVAVAGGAVLATNLRRDAPTISSAVAAAQSPVMLSITFGPPGASAKLDGLPLAASPFVARMPRDGSLHRLEFEGPGLEPETRLVSYERDVSVEVVLRAADAPDAASASPSTSPAASPSASPATARNALPATSPFAPSPGKPRLPPASPSARPRDPAALTLDSKDPYKP